MGNSPAHPAVYARLAHKVEQLQQRLRDIVARHAAVKLASSLAVEDMVLTDALAQIGGQTTGQTTRNTTNHTAGDAAGNTGNTSNTDDTSHAGTRVEVFTLQTGRLHAETLDLLAAVRQRYPQLPFRLYQPDAQALADYVRRHGENAFYDSVDMRHLCCAIRKVEPLNRALADADAWLTGQRREQSLTRSALALAEHDSARNICKYNPIFDWSEQDVWAYILQFDIPYNALYHQGYPSIGCEPCTMPVKAGEDIRSGRWWWEQRDSKECGLHT